MDEGKREGKTRLGAKERKDIKNEWRKIKIRGKVTEGDGKKEEKKRKPEK